MIYVHSKTGDLTSDRAIVLSMYAKRFHKFLTNCFIVDLTPRGEKDETEIALPCGMPYLCITGIGWTLSMAVGSHIAYGNPEVSSLGRRTTTFERPRSTAVVAAEFMYFLDNNFVGCAFPSSITGHKLQWVHGRQ